MANERARGLGYKFITDDKYLIDPFSPTDGISYEGDGSPVSYANSMGGIMSQAPIPGPLKYIPEGGDDRDGPPGAPLGPKGPSGITGYDSLGNPISEDMSIGSAAKNVFGFFTNPLGFLGVKAYRAYKDKKAKQELQDFYNAEKSAAAKTTQNMARDNKASNTGGYQAGYGGDFMDGPSGAGRGNAPSDKGGSDSMGSFAKGGRVGYFFGGRVNYKAGGRTDAESQYGADSVGSYDSSANQSDRGQIYGNNNPPVSNDNRVVTTDFISENPSLTVDYTDPKNYASVYGKIGFDNLIDNDDLTAKGNVTGQFGPIGYDASLTEKGLTGIDLTAGNFSANISPDMQVQNIGYSKGPFSISSDGQNTRAGLTFSYKNGGLAGLL